MKKPEDRPSSKMKCFGDPEIYNMKSLACSVCPDQKECQHVVWKKELAKKAEEERIEDG